MTKHTGRVTWCTRWWTCWIGKEDCQRVRLCFERYNCHLKEKRRAIDFCCIWADNSFRLEIYVYKGTCTIEKMTPPTSFSNPKPTCYFHRVDWSPSSYSESESLLCLLPFPNSLLWVIHKTPGSFGAAAGFSLQRSITTPPCFRLLWHGSDTPPQPRMSVATLSGGTPWKLLAIMRCECHVTSSVSNMHEYCLTLIIEREQSINFF